jgi:hypothetical protein
MLRPLVRDNFVTIANKNTARILDPEIDSGFIRGRNLIRCKKRNAPTSFQPRLAIRLGASNECP